jgi:hypothetical protein
MPIPLLIGGVIAVAATAITAAVVSQNSSGRSSSSGVNDEELRTEKEKEFSDQKARKELLTKYSRQLAKNLAEKYGGLDSVVLENGLRTGNLKPFNLLEHTAYFNEKQKTVDDLQGKLAILNDALAQLEALNEQFK